MTDCAAAATAPAYALTLPSLRAPARPWLPWLSHGLSAALLIVVVLQLRAFDLAMLRAAVPKTPLFAATLLALYLALPVADWIIFRRLWRLPLAGFPMLLRKRISNELLLSYSGEAWFYLWARERAGLTAAPFGTIKDVNILSALAGNLVTLVLLGLAYPLVTQLSSGDYASAALWSAVLMLAVSLGALLFGRRLFTLPRRELLIVFGIHVARLVVTTSLAALLWHIAMPATPIGLWLALAVLRLLVSRLPLLPNKDILFATIAVFLLGGEQEVAALVAMTSAATLGLHILFGAGLGAAALAAGGRR